MTDNTRDGAGGDPRPDPREPAFASDGRGLRPRVASTGGTGRPWLLVGGAVALGLIVLFMLMARRSSSARHDEISSRPSATISAPPPPPDLALVEAAGRAPAFAVTGPQTPPTAFPMAPPIVAAPAAIPSGLSPDDVLRRKAPSLVIDLAAPADRAGGSDDHESAPASALAGSSGGEARDIRARLSGDEQFAARVGAAEPDHVRATPMRDRRSTVPQGTMIPAVLETAMNSDLPGFVRAVVSRDVRGFDGSAILIPRGSRLVGQYKSGLSQGASRIFVIWTRVLRPDGASVLIGSPGGDPLGRAGQEGKVHSHFFRQFASSILLSVINAEISRLAQFPTTQIIIGGAAAGVVSQPPSYTGAPYPGAPVAGAPTGGSGDGGATAFPPTITVAQGAPISIFVARDLDFSSVGGEAR